MHTIVDILELGSYFFSPGPVTPSEEALVKHCSQPHARERLEQVRAAFAPLTAFAAADVERAVRELAAAQAVKASEYIHPLRGRGHRASGQPGHLRSVRILGHERVLERIDALLGFLREHAALQMKTVS